MFPPIGRSNAYRYLIIRRSNAYRYLIIGRSNAYRYLIISRSNAYRYLIIRRSSAYRYLIIGRSNAYKHLIIGRSNAYRYLIIGRSNAYRYLIKEGLHRPDVGCFWQNIFRETRSLLTVTEHRTHGLINNKDTKPSMSSSMVFNRVYGLVIQSVMLVFSTSFVKYCPSNLLPQSPFTGQFFL